MSAGAESTQQSSGKTKLNLGLERNLPVGKTPRHGFGGGVWIGKLLRCVCGPHSSGVRVWALLLRCACVGPSRPLQRLSRLWFRHSCGFRASVDPGGGMVDSPKNRGQFVLPAQFAQFVFCFMRAEFVALGSARAILPRFHRVENLLKMTVPDGELCRVLRCIRTSSFCSVGRTSLQPHHQICSNQTDSIFG